LRGCKRLQDDVAVKLSHYVERLQLPAGGVVVPCSGLELVPVFQFPPKLFRFAK
jgi:hypothetical protein